MRIGRYAVICLASAVLILGCRTWPNDPAPGPSLTELGFVGIGSIDGSPANVLIVFDEGDSSAYQSGSITYHSATSTFTELLGEATADTLIFTYSRAGTDYRGMARQSAAGLNVHFTQPATIPDFVANREIGGYNMTGLWSGEMSSTILQGQTFADMSMNQSGALFLGDADVSFFEPWSFHFTSGSYSGNSFQLTGTVSTGTGTTSATFDGNYSEHDRINGNWSAGDETLLDAGQFAFTRSFQ